MLLPEFLSSGGPEDSGRPELTSKAIPDRILTVDGAWAEIVLATSSIPPSVLNESDAGQIPVGSQAGSQAVQAVIDRPRITGVPIVGEETVLVAAYGEAGRSILDEPETTRPAAYLNQADNDQPGNVEAPRDEPTADERIAAAQKLVANVNSSVTVTRINPVQRTGSMDGEQSRAA